MSMLDSFFAKGFKAAKCKTLLKLTIPRIKLLRNRREIQIKQMRKEIAKLLETGQEATARIRVEHIIREEKMMAAQEVVELFCELISVRLPIIEAQRECPLDLKEAISSVCFAAPRCADLPELLQVQMLFAAKYGKEFVSAATELMPECGVTRQLIELLSVRAPAPDVKLKLLKEIAEEHQVDWDPSNSETALLKPHEDLLNGPTQFVSGTKVPLPAQKLEEQAPVSEQTSHEESEDDGFDELDLPVVPKQPIRPGNSAVITPEMLPFPASALDDDHELRDPSSDNEVLPQKLNMETERVLQGKPVREEIETPSYSDGTAENKQFKQFVPFISLPPQSPGSFSTRESEPPSSIAKTSGQSLDLQDVLAAAQAAAETAERAAAAARSAASLAQARISGLVKKQNQASDTSIENPFHADPKKTDLKAASDLNTQDFPGDADDIVESPGPYPDPVNYSSNQLYSHLSYDDVRTENLSPTSNSRNQGSIRQPPQRLPSMDDETYFPYANLFTSRDQGLRSESFPDNSKSTH